MTTPTVMPTDRAAVHPATPAGPLDAGDIGRHLANAGSDDWRVVVVETTASTSSDLLASVRDERFTPSTILAAETQTGGRGRRGRGWASAAGASLTVSFALRVARPISALDGVTLVCGLAARDVVARRGVVARLKWPNDLLVDGRKLAGILVESHRQADATVLVIGVGLNVVATRSTDDVDGHGLPPIDLIGAGATDVDRNRLAAELAVALRDRLETFAVGGFASFVAAWNAADAFRDRPVALHADHGAVIDGIARGVDRSGALMLDVDGVRRHVVSGDVSLRPKDERGTRAR